MPALLELQQALRAQLLGEALPPDQASALRVAIYRNTCLSTLVNALRLSFPAVQRLVGADFFEAAAREFIRASVPTSAYLNDYGADFPGFLSHFAPAAGLVYLGDVARLEWAVNRALHAGDAPRLEPTGLTRLDEAALSRVSFTAHPAVTLLRLESPADAIWRSVLEQNDAAMAAIDLTGGPVHELRASVPNRPGVIAEIALALGGAGVNILDMVLSPSQDNSQGIVALWIAGERHASRAEQLVADLGFPVVKG